MPTFLKRVQISKIVLEDKVPLFSNTKNACTEPLSQDTLSSLSTLESHLYVCLETWGITGPVHRGGPSKTNSNNSNEHQQQTT